MQFALQEILPEDHRQQQTYLGDGIYASHDGYHVWLCTLEGQRLALDPDVITALVNYNLRIRTGDEP